MITPDPPLAVANLRAAVLTEMSIPMSDDTCTPELETT